MRRHLRRLPRNGTGGEDLSDKIVFLKKSAKGQTRRAAASGELASLRRFGATSGLPADFLARAEIFKWEEVNERPFHHPRARR